MAEGIQAYSCQRGSGGQRCMLSIDWGRKRENGEKISSNISHTVMYRIHSKRRLRVSLLNWNQPFNSFKDGFRGSLRE